MITYVYQVPVEVYKQFIEYLKSFEIKYNIERDDTFPHTYGIIKVEAEQEVQNDVEITLSKLIVYANGR